MIKSLPVIAFVTLMGLAPLAVAATDILDPAAPVTAPAAAAPAKEPETLWLVRCDDMKEKGKYCEAFQNLSVKKKDSDPVKRIAEFAIGYGPDKKKKAQVVIILPLGVLVNQKLDIVVDEKSQAEAEIRYCEVSGCYAFTELSEGVLDKMRKGQNITVKGKAANGQNLHIVMGLKGLDAALAQLKS